MRLFEFDSKPLLHNPKFKAWFGNSKVVDSNGNPLVCFHGTRKSFSEFKMNDSIKYGMYFTDSSEYANDYTGGIDGSNIVAVYLRIQNPIPYKEFVSRYRKDRSNALASLIKEGYDGVITDKYSEWFMDKFLVPVDQKDNPGVFIVFSSNQIKSAIGNNGNYSSSDGRITESK